MINAKFLSRNLIFSGCLRSLFVALALLVSAFIPHKALADHSLGRACTDCHSLRSARVSAGTRNILEDNLLSDLYATRWYCPSPGANVSFVGGQPLDCSYCHGQAATDVGAEFRKGKSEASGSAHPIVVDGDNIDGADPIPYPANRIYCNSCHNSDVTPLDKCDKDVTDGYPNHKNRTANSIVTGGNGRTDLDSGDDGVHLKGPYGRADWVDVPGNYFDPISSEKPFCFDCHNASTVGGAPDIESKYIWKDANGQNSSYSGHNYADAAASSGNYNTEMPCYNCHDPHATYENKKLIVEISSSRTEEVGEDGERRMNPYKTSFYKNIEPPPGTAGAVLNYPRVNTPDGEKEGDRSFCYSCHSGYSVRTGPNAGDPEVVLDDVLAPGWLPRIWSWHKKVHNSVKEGAFAENPLNKDPNPSGSCTPKYGGCHDPHRTIPTCPECHEGGICDMCHGFPPISDDEPTPKPVKRGNYVPNERIAGEEVDGVRWGNKIAGGAHRRHVNLFWKRFDPHFDPTAHTTTASENYASSLSETPAPNGGTDQTDPDYWFKVAAAICGPCHGENPGNAPWHNESGDISFDRSYVDIRPRSNDPSLTADNSSTELGYTWASSDNSKTTYYGESAPSHDMSVRLPDTVDSNYKVNPNIKQVCANLDCHGRPDPDAPADVRDHKPEDLRWNDTKTITGIAEARKKHSSGIYEVEMKTAICKWCHDSTEARIILRDIDGNIYYHSAESSEWGGLCGGGNPDGSSSGAGVDPLVKGVTENYFMPQSGYSRGGHGDAHITDNPNLDPTFIDSATGPTPVDCTQCHTDIIADYTKDRNTSGCGNRVASMDHFAATASSSRGIHRLKAGYEADNDLLCKSCHYADYFTSLGESSGPKHHPSRLMMAGGNGALWDFSPWWPTSSYNQPSGVTYAVQPPLGDVDEFVDYWNDPTQIDLPRFGDIWDSADKGLSCSTCHNPHGTDLNVTWEPEPVGHTPPPEWVDPITPEVHGGIPDNNMLRLQATDNTLCVACH